MDSGIMSTPGGMASDAGNSDDHSGTVAGAVAQAMARQAELASDTHGQGTTIGDLVPLPPMPVPFVPADADA